MSAPLQIMLGIVTFRRTKMLAEALDSLTSQSIFNSDVSVEVVIVDNDAEGSAEAVYEDYASRFPCQLSYVLEARRGIPYARNKVLEHAIGRGASSIAFIDDDETAEPDWLESLHRVITESGADAVQGPVISQVPEGAPAWAERKTRKQSRRNEGEPKEKAATNNVIFSTAIAKDGGIRFDDRYAMSGGSDVDFFLRATRAGYRLIWTHQAKVHHLVPARRITLKWQFRRAQRVAATSTLSAVVQMGVGYALRRYLLKIVARLLGGPALLLTGGLFLPGLRLLAVQWIGSGIGHLGGFWGAIGEEYSTIHS